MDVGDIANAMSEFFHNKDQLGLRVTVNPQEFIRILARATAPLVIAEDTGVIREQYVYVTIYRGLAVMTKSGEKLTLPADADTIQASDIAGLD